MLKFDIFKNFSRRKLEQLYCYYLFELNLKKGQYLFREGDTYLGVFFIVNGRCEKIKEDPNQSRFTDISLKEVSGHSPLKNKEVQISPQKSVKTMPKQYTLSIVDGGEIVGADEIL